MNYRIFDYLAITYINYIKMANLLLTNLPEDLRRIILEKQRDLKQSRGTNQISLSLTIYVIIREWAQLTKKTR